MCLAVPGKIMEMSGADLDREGRVDFGGVVRRVSLAAVPEAGIGDYVLIHAGFAIARVDEEEARKTLALFAEMEGTDPVPPSSIPEDSREIS